MHVKETMYELTESIEYGLAGINYQIEVHFKNVPISDGDRYKVHSAETIWFYL